jgi:hypothetical protein
VSPPLIAEVIAWPPELPAFLLRAAPGADCWPCCDSAALERLLSALHLDAAAACIASGRLGTRSFSTPLGTRLNVVPLGSERQLHAALEAAVAALAEVGVVLLVVARLRFSPLMVSDVAVEPDVEVCAGPRREAPPRR